MLHCDNSGLSIPAYKTPSSRIDIPSGGKSDEGSAMRYVLTRDEEAFLKGFAACMSKKPESVGKEAAFDFVSCVIVRRHYGYIDEWQNLSSWTEQDWDRWLAATNG